MHRLRRQPAVASAAAAAAAVTRRGLATGLQVVYRSYGDPEAVLELCPSPDLPAAARLAPNAVNVRFLASSINPADINQIQGVYKRLPPSLPAVAGNEGVAQVLDVGSSVHGLCPGDRVLCASSCLGTWRTHATLLESQLWKIRPTLPLAEAATLSVNFCTAYRMLKDFTPLGQGAAVIQNGATSGVGQAVIQLARAWRIPTINVLRLQGRPNPEETSALLQSQGANLLLDEDELQGVGARRELRALGPIRLALNGVGGKSATNLCRALADGGVMVTYGGMSRQPVQIATSALIFRDLRFQGFWMTRWNEEADLGTREAMMEELQDLVLQQQLRANIRPHKLEDMVAAVASARSPYRIAKDIFVMPESG